GENCYKNAKAIVWRKERMGRVEYWMAMMYGVRVEIDAQSVGVEQEAYNEGLAYAKERAQFGKKIITFPAVYDMLSRMKAKLDAGRSLLYQTARYVDLYKALEDIARDQKLTPEERQEMKKYTRLADAFTPLAKGINSEYANQTAYDAISIHGGSGFIMEYKSQQLYRDARIFSIYEGTTQLQVVAAVRYITNGTYLSIMKEMLEDELTCDCMKTLRDCVARLVQLYEEAVEKVNAGENQDVHDFLARRLYNMTADIIGSLLLIEDAAKAPELFKKSANVFVRMAEEEVIGSTAYIKAFNPEDLEQFKATDDEPTEA
uniref:acyl-CoA dehydrogenase family protein n=1 Tax=Prevotella denticola TaxID=28129 RepID=UPI002880B863